MIIFRCDICGREVRAKALEPSYFASIVRHGDVDENEGYDLCYTCKIKVCSYIECLKKKKNGLSYDEYRATIIEADKEDKNE